MAGNMTFVTDGQTYGRTKGKTELVIEEGPKTVGSGLRAIFIWKQPSPRINPSLKIVYTTLAATLIYLP